MSATPEDTNTQDEKLEQIAKRIAKLMCPHVLMGKSNSLPTFYLATYLREMRNEVDIVKARENFQPYVWELRSDAHCPLPWHKVGDEHHNVYTILDGNQKVIALNMSESEANALITRYAPKRWN